MIAINFYKNKEVGVLGLGATGLATAKSLLAGGASVISWDDNAATRKKALSLLPVLRLLPPEASDWRGVAALVSSPGIDEKHDLIQDLALLKLPIVGDVELFARAVKNKGATIIAITGTNGKSTTTALTAHILKSAGFDVQMGGNIGTPALALAPPTKNTIYVLEISSYQADRLETLAPTIAVQLNLTPDHIGRHGSLANYAAAKAKLFQCLPKESLAVINTQDRFGKSLYEKITTRKIELNKIKLPRQCDTKSYNKENIFASYAMAQFFNIKDEVFNKGLLSFKPLAHRQEVIAEINGVLYINDSKATNADATKIALEQYKNIHWLAGGAPKGEGFAVLEPYLNNINHAYLFGAAADDLSKFLDKKVSHSKYKTLEEATHSAIKNAKRGVVLLSPSCASFDAFSDFTARGRAFSAYVRAEQSPTLIAAAGGTGGGIFPAEGLAHALHRQGKSVYLFHDSRAKRYIDNKQWDKTRKIISAPMAARSVLGLVGASFLMALGVLQSIILLLSIRGDKAIIGFGGYPSVPVVVAGVILRIPIVLHEPGGVLGRANRILLRFARRLSLAVPLKEKVAKSIVLGNPVRPKLLQWCGLPYVLPSKQAPFNILIFAGSQGAEWFDENLAPALCLVAKKHKLSVVQQTRSQEEKITKLYDKAGIGYQLAPFFDDIARHIAQSHLVIARAGASTISELALLGRPAILIPHRGAAPSAEQKSNAESFVSKGRGWIEDEQAFSPEKLAQKISELIENPKALRTAAQSEANQANEKLAQLILSEVKNV